MLTFVRPQRGFSLIELVLAISILGILTALSIPSFAIWMQNSQIRTAAQSISDGLQLSRAEAIRRNTNVQFSLAGTSNVNSSWTVGCVIPVGDLNGDGIADCPASIQSRSASEGTAPVIINSNFAAVTFAGLGRPNTSMTINVSNPNGGACLTAGGQLRCMRIVVGSGGSIRMCDPNLPSSNPQGC